MPLADMIADRSRWAIRNCGLLFLRSLIDCLFRTSESKIVTEAGWDGKSIRLSYDQYPSLPELLVKLLHSDTNSSATSTTTLIESVESVESVFPSLDIIRRAGPPAIYRDEIFQRLSTHLESKIWHVREIAARTICTMMLHTDWLQDVLHLISSIGTSANRSHGTLMAIKFILERRLKLDPTTATGKQAIISIVSWNRLSFLIRWTIRYCCSSEDHREF